MQKIENDMTVYFLKHQNMLHGKVAIPVTIKSCNAAFVVAASCTTENPQKEGTSLELES